MDKRNLYSLISSIFGKRTNIKTEGRADKTGDKDSDGPVESMAGEKGGASKSENNEEIDLSFLDD